MAQQKVLILSKDYEERLREAIRLAGGERLNATLPNGIEAYHLGKIRATVVYDGNLGVHIMAATGIPINRTFSMLERKVSLIIPKLGEETYHG